MVRRRRRLIHAHRMARVYAADCLRWGTPPMVLRWYWRALRVHYHAHSWDIHQLVEDYSIERCEGGGWDPPREP